MKRIVLLLLVIKSAIVHAQTYSPDWTSLDARPVPQWFTDAKFGIFIHWGVYSVPAWAPVGKDYAVYSKYSEWYWNRLVTDSSKVGKAFRAYHNGTYGPSFKYQDFAPLFKAELFNPEQWADVFKNAGAQYVVLTSQHHDGFALWPSAEAWNWNAADVGPHKDLAGELTNAVKAKSLHMGFYYSLYEWFNPLYKSDINKYVSEHMMPQLKDLVMRYKPDIIWPDGEWEHPSDTWKSQEFLAWLYNESPVNIGPAADGTIPVIMQQRLADMGAWLKTNGEAIFGTTAARLVSANGVYFTQKNKDLYVILTTKIDKPLTIDLPRAPLKATLLGSTKKVSISYRGGKCTINPVDLYPNLPSGGYAWVIKLEGAHE